MPTPPLTAASTTSEESAEEFPLQESYETGSAVLTKIEFTPQASIKSVRPKRFSLKAIARPLIRSARGRSAKGSTTQAISHDDELRSAQKAAEGKYKAKRRNRVSFSPSIDDEHGARDKRLIKLATKARLRRASFSDSIGKSGQQPLRQRALSISWDSQGMHVATTKGSKTHRSPSLNKGTSAGPRTTKQQAEAAKNAAKHARALEQIINAGASLDVDSIEILKAKREAKTGGKLDKSKVQMIPAVSPLKVKALGAALLDSVTANDIIGELRALQLQQTSTMSHDQGQASALLLKVQRAANDADKAKQLAPRPIKAICLDCREEDIDKRQMHSALAIVSDKQALSVQEEVTAASPSVTTLWGWTGWLRPQAKETVALDTVAEIASSPSPAETIDGLLSGVNPISFILSPSAITSPLEASQQGAFDAIGVLSGAAIRAANGGELEMQGVHPPLDRLAVLIHWWGFELTIPEPSMAYLGRAHNISSSLMSILQTVAVTGGVPEILPFIRYFSTFVDMEFGAIKSQNHGHGVVVAATWLMPMALVPRPWDYPIVPAQSTRPPLQPSSASQLSPSSIKGSDSQVPLLRRESASLAR
jgi:hypothetical protein